MTDSLFFPNAPASPPRRAEQDTEAERRFEALLSRSYREMRARGTRDAARVENA